MSSLMHVVLSTESKMFSTGTRERKSNFRDVGQLHVSQLSNHDWKVNDTKLCEFLSWASNNCCAISLVIVKKDCLEPVFS